MDRLKFRVWCDQTKRYNSDGMFLLSNGMLYENVGEYADDLVAIEATVEQCTGLKDRNGKLIYEGDIVQQYEWDGFDEDCNDIFVMGDWRDREVVRYGHHNCGCCDNIYGFSFGEVSPDAGDNYQIEVVGNIHENPELLGD